MLLSHAEVIQAFGGYQPLARDLGIEPQRAKHWLKRGIPAKFWPGVELAGKRRGIEITAWKLSELMDKPVDAPA